MRSGWRNPVLLALLFLPGLFAALAALQLRIDAQTRTIAQEKEELLLRSGSLLKKVSLGYDALLADIYWTRVIQYYGTKLNEHDTKFELLPPLLELTTTLDPQLMPAYRFGALFLSEPAPVGPGRSDLAVPLIQRGIASNPTDWNLYFDLGFLYFWHLRDFDAAAATFKKASEVPGAPSWLTLLAANISDRKSALQTSLMIWTQIYETARHPVVKQRALQQLITLRVQKEEDLLDQGAMEYRRRFGHNPASGEDLVKAGILRALPLDPSGVPYAFEADGHARLDPKSTIVLVPGPGFNPR